ncbi:MAG: MFS transporter, partial [Pseudoalteromonas tunicata]|nr:MFS transporter [Pseudoalteromonas tunicata]
DDIDDIDDIDEVNDLAQMDNDEETDNPLKNHRQGELFSDNTNNDTNNPDSFNHGQMKDLNSLDDDSANESTTKKRP